MNIKGYINAGRRKILRLLTHNIGTNKTTPDLHISSIRRVLISRPNSRLGNQLLITPIVCEIENVFPNAKIDIFVRGGIAPILFANYKNVDRIIKLPKKPFKELFTYIGVWLSLKKKKYDLVINIDGGSSSGRLSTQFCNSKFKIFNDIDADLMAEYVDYVHIAKLPVYNFRKYIKELGIDVDYENIPVLDIKLTDEELADGKTLLDSLTDPTKKTISLYTFATGHKCYSKEWWYETYERIKEEYDDKYNILEVLPVENVSQIDFQASSYYSRDLRLMAALIASTEIFITADCGIMHLASATKTPVVGLFSAANISKYHPYNRGSIGFETNNQDINGLISSINNILQNNNTNTKSTFHDNADNML